MNKNHTLSQYLPLLQSRVISPNHGCYSLTLRETEGVIEALQRLKNDREISSDTRHKIHFGWGSYRNLDIIAARRSQYAIICDISLHQIEMWNITLSLLKEAKSPEEYIHRFAIGSRKSPRPRFPIKLGITFQEWLMRDLSRETSWLGTLESFLYVKDLALDQKIEILCCDIRDRTILQDKYFFSNIRKSLEFMFQDEFAFPDTLYLSNLPWMMKNEAGFFGETHTDKYEDIKFPGYSMMLENLKIITPLFSKVISAHLLADSSSADSVEWKTSLYDADEYIAQLQQDTLPNPYPLHSQSR